jgi:hypothetical protein
MLRHLKGLSTSFGFEMRELGSLVEEVVVGRIQVTQGMLQGLGVGLSQPFIPWLFFQLGQLEGGVVVGQAFFLVILVCSVVVDPGSQEVIVDKPASSKLAGYPFFLSQVWVQTEFEGLHHVH